MASGKASDNTKPQVRGGVRRINRINRMVPGCARGQASDQMRPAGHCRACRMLAGCLRGIRQGKTAGQSLILPDAPD